MTRKDYQLIASVIKQTYKNEDQQVAEVAIQTVAVSLAAQLKKDNPNFKAALFLQACGVSGHANNAKGFTVGEIQHWIAVD